MIAIDTAALADEINMLRACAREHPGAYTSVVGAFDGAEIHLVVTNDPSRLHLAGRQPAQALIRFV